MKKLFTTLLMLTISWSAMSQIIIVTATDTLTDQNGQTITVYGNTTDEMIQYMKVKNMGSSDIDLKVRATEEDVCSTTQNTTCWVLCPAFKEAGVTPVFVSTYASTLTPGVFDTTFAAHYEPEGQVCCSQFLYEWLDVNNSSSVVGTLRVRFVHTPDSVCTASVGENFNRVNIEIAPNPVSNQINFTLNNLEEFRDVTYEVMDQLGRVVYEPRTLNAFAVSIDVSTQPEGVYTLLLKRNGELISSKKLVIKH